MARVICTLPHAAELISGVKFILDRGERISEEVEEKVAALFDNIPGFRRAGDATGGRRGGKSPEAPKQEATTPAPAAAPDAPKAEPQKPAAPADAPKSGESAK